MLAMMPPMPPRSQLIEDFSGRSTSSNYVGQGWSIWDSASGFTTQVDAVGTALTGKAGLVDVQGSTDTVRRLTFDAVGSVQDVEILMRVRFTGGNDVDNGQGAVRMSATGSGGHFSYFGSWNGAGHPTLPNTWGIDETTTANGATDAGSLIEESWSFSDSSTWYWQRIRVSGTQLRGKQWTHGSAEPDWVGTASVNQFSGYVGVGGFEASQSYHFDFFSAAVGGGSAPGPAG